MLFYFWQGLVNCPVRSPPPIPVPHHALACAH